MSAVNELPPSESHSMCVNFESRYGTWRLDSVRAVITFPRAERDLLIDLASVSVIFESSDLLTRSDPARSTR